MRITNKMMTNNMMNNINKNKFNMTSLEQQYSTGKKIQRPSDDPIIAVRALKLRTNLAELEQYTEKNIPDAMSWMDVTESALDTVNNLLKQINTYCVQGSSDTLTATDRSAIVDNLKQMKDQIYQEGNTNYAGRYVFTGYKTDSSLLFDQNTENLTYEINESFSGKEIQVGSKVVGSYTWNEMEGPSKDTTESPRLVNSYRMQLSYDQLDNTTISGIAYTKSSDGKEWVEQEPFQPIKTISSLDPKAYTPEANEVYFIPETGELVMGEDAYEEFRTAEDIRVNYSKSSFSKGDLRPEHYYNCVMTDVKKPEQDPITYTKTRQEIQYEVNYNQKLTINTEGSDSITHKIGRQIDDILDSVNNVLETESKIAELEKRLQNKDLTEVEKKNYETILEQLGNELELKKDVMQKNFSRGITVSNEEQNRVNVALADLGSRYVRLELTENRLESQKVDFEDLLSKNEDADLVDTIIKYNSAQTIYNASLSAASKIVQASLLDFL